MILNVRTVEWNLQDIIIHQYIQGKLNKKTTFTCNYFFLLYYLDKRTLADEFAQPDINFCCSSTNAFMLTYQQISPERNTKFLELCEVPKHIAELICKLRNEEEMERRRKEMDRCMCKVQFPLLSVKLDPSHTTEPRGRKRLLTVQFSSLSHRFVQCTHVIICRHDSEIKILYRCIIIFSVTDLGMWCKFPYFV